MTGTLSQATRYPICLRASNKVHFVTSHAGDLQTRADRVHCIDDALLTLIDLNGGALVDGDAVALQTAYGLYWTALPDGRLRADTQQLQLWETFKIHLKSGSGVIGDSVEVGLQSAHGKWLVAEQGGGELVKVDRPQMLGWETFMIHILPRDSRVYRVCFKTYDQQHYLTGQANATQLNASATSCGGAAIHTLLDENGGVLKHGDSVFVRTISSWFYTADPGGALGSFRTWPLGFERFTIVRADGEGNVVPGDKIGLRSTHQTYIVAEGGGGQIVRVNRSAMGAWETFTLSFPAAPATNPSQDYVSHMMMTPGYTSQTTPLQQSMNDAKRAYDEAKRKLDELLAKAKDRLGVPCIESKIERCKAEEQCRNVCHIPQMCTLLGCINLSEVCNPVCQVVNNCWFESVWNCTIVPEAQRTADAAKAEYDKRKSAYDAKVQALQEAAKKRFDDAKAAAANYADKAWSEIQKLSVLGDSFANTLKQDVERIAKPLIDQSVQKSHSLIQSLINGVLKTTVALAKGKLQKQLDDMVGVMQDFAEVSARRKAADKRMAELAERWGEEMSRRKKVLKQQTGELLSWKTAGLSAAAVMIEVAAMMGAGLGTAGIKCKDQRTTKDAYAACFQREFADASKYTFFEMLVNSAYTPFELKLVIPVSAAIAISVTAIVAAATAGVGAVVVGAIVGFVVKTGMSLAVMQAAERLMFPHYEKHLWPLVKPAFEDIGKSAGHSFYE